MVIWYECTDYCEGIFLIYGRGRDCWIKMMSRKKLFWDEKYERDKSLENYYDLVETSPYYCNVN